MVELAAKLQVVAMKIAEIGGRNCRDLRATLRKKLGDFAEVGDTEFADGCG